jgi:phage-related protein (TIGR01555 family)
MKKKVAPIKKKVLKNSQVKNNGALQQFTQQACRPSEVSQLDLIQNNLRYGALTLNPMLITEMLQEHALVRRFIRQPIEDAYRGGVQIKCDEFSADDIHKLQQKMEECNDIQLLIEAREWAEAFGGAGIIVNAGQEFDKEFSLEQIKQDSKLEFYAADRWELNQTTTGNALDQTVDPLSDVPYLYYSHKLHRSCVLRLEGQRAPSRIRGQFSGWGVSRLEGIVRSWNQYLKHQEIAYELADECKLDVFRMDGFNEALASADGVAQVTARVQLSAELKNYKNALVMDKDDEFEQKSISFSGIPEMMNENRKGICADLGTPMTKLFGLSASGFNSGEDDIETWNAKIESEVRSKDRNALLFMIQARCKQLFGYVPDSISFEFKSLRVLSEEQEQTIKDKKLDRILRLKQEGLIPAQTAIGLINAEKIFALDLEENEVEDVQQETEQAEGTGTRSDAGKPL